MSNSLYKIDTKAMTWERTFTSGQSGHIRNESGTLRTIPEIIVGQSAFLNDTAILPDYDGHGVLTSIVEEFSCEN